MDLIAKVSIQLIYRNTIQSPSFNMEVGMVVSNWLYTCIIT